MFGKIFFGLFMGIVGLAMVDKVSIGSMVEKYNFTKMKASIKREEAIKDAVVRYIIDKNTEPTMADLINNNYISSTTNDNGFGGSYSLAVDRSKGTITVSTEFADSKQRDLYSKMYTRSFKSTTSGNIVTTQYVIPSDALNADIADSFRTAVGDIAPDPTQYTFWIDTSSSPAIKKVSNGTAWKTYTVATTGGSTVVTTDNTVASSTDLPTSGVSDGDVKYVLNSGGDVPVIEEYVYVNGGWYLANSGAGGSATVSEPTVVYGDCPAGFVIVPGSVDVFGQAKGWCVAKYEMTPYSTSGYSSNYAAYNWQDIYDSDSSKKVTSKAQNPLNYVSSNNARSICSNTHLVDQYGNTINGGYPMRYDVWQVLAKDLALNPQNWSGGTVGSGYIFSGHNDNSPAATITPSTNDADGYANTGNSGNNQRRTLFTSNGDAIWDLAGNVWEEMYEQQSVGDANWIEYTSVTANAFSPYTILGSSYNYNSSQGVGQSYGDNANNDISKLLVSGSYWLLRGGYWNNGSSAGLFASTWNASSVSHRSYNVGVRCIVPAQ